MRFNKAIWLLIPVVFLISCSGWLSGGGGGGQIVDPGDQPPSVTLPGSLHGTAAGMQWWYEQPEGAGALFGVDYETTGCGNCHIETCDQCHVNADGSGGVNEPDACIVCHGRLDKEAALGVTDLHFEAGMVCSDCHDMADMHGDGTAYNSMLESGNASCADCHSKSGSAAAVPDTQSHTVHGDVLSCDACHMSSAVTCYNCHFETLLTSHEKKAAGAFKDFIFLLNDDNGKVRAGTYQSVFYDDKSFIAFGPFHGHSVTSEGRACADCHGNELIQELSANDSIVVAEWDEDEGKIVHATGVIPFVPDKLEYTFVDFDGTNWSPAKMTIDQLQYEFCTPLTDDQLESLGYSEGGATGPLATLGTSLHGTARGMQYWYDQPDGAGAMFGVDYAATGCGNCHTNGCDDCHVNADGTGGVNEPDACKVCHGRIAKEEAIGVTDLHFEAGMTCSDCHSSHEMHGDGTEYDSMLSPGAMDTRCEDCHVNGDAAAVPDTISHTVHDNIRCDACHMAAAVTCYNCHFETLLDSHEKKAAAAFKDFILLLNDDNGDVRAGTYQSVYYDDNGFVAFGPFHGHSVTADGRGCADCHNNERIQEYNDTGMIVMSTWDDGEGKVAHTTGVVPFVPDDFVFQFVDYDGTNWSPVDPSDVQYQYEFCTPLTTDQLDALSTSPPSVLLETSLHGTAAGMQWWYEQEDGAGALFGVDYASTGCGNCHVETCDQCHVNADGTGGVNEPDACKVCHGRLAKEEQLGVTDLHFEAGMVCSDCHPVHEMHGDGTAYNSMLQDGAMTVDCENCHPDVEGSGDPYTHHNAHGGVLKCDACHMESAVTCYNCHFETLLDSHEKKAAAAFKDFIFLLNDADGYVRAGTYQSVSYDGKTFIAFGPFHGHSVTRENARDCEDCHGSARMQEYHLTGEVVVTEWDEDQGKVVHTTGVIPFVPEALVYQFVDFDGTNWAPSTTDIDQIQYEYCTPLTEDQLDALALAYPGDTLGTSLHATAAGMQWWYEQADGLGDLIGIDYAATGCGNCHIDTTAADGGCSECHGTADVHDPITDQAAVCVGCHGRQNAEINLGLEDVHFNMGFECSDCHMYDIHGDGMTYNTMLDDGAIKAKCENCHEELDMTVTEHTMHSETLHCDACHLSTVITCYNCHFDSLLDEHVKRPIGPRQGFVLLLNDTRIDKVRAGTYQSVIEGGDTTFIAFGPFHGHSITADGRTCDDCHDNDRITELNDTGKIVMTWWDDGAVPATIAHTTGVIPFDPTFLEFTFVDYDSGAGTWSPVGTELDQYQYEFCEPLTADQLADLGVD